jgi:hypothetical protein
MDKVQKHNDSQRKYYRGIDLSCFMLTSQYLNVSTGQKNRALGHSSSQITFKPEFRTSVADWAYSVGVVN